MRYPTVILLAVTLGACTTAGRGADNSDVGLLVTPERVAPGDTVTLVLRNDSDDTLGYNLCTSSLFRRTESDTWDPVPSDRACTMELRTLSPRQRATLRIDLPQDLAPATYRFESTVERLEPSIRETVTSGTFTVET